jgi:hypothetical protein
MNNIKTKSHNKLEGFHLKMLMRIKSYLADEFEVDLDDLCLFALEKRQEQVTEIGRD